MKQNIEELLFSSQINFNNLEQMNPFIKDNPMYWIAKTQLDEALKTITDEKEK